MITQDDANAAGASLIGGRSLRETAEQFRVLVDELVSGRKKRRRRRGSLALQELDELFNGLLFPAA
jgi:hypothetical protein